MKGLNLSPFKQWLAETRSILGAIGEQTFNLDTMKTGARDVMRSLNSAMRDIEAHAVKAYDAMKYRFAYDNKIAEIDEQLPGFWEKKQYELESRRFSREKRRQIIGSLLMPFKAVAATGLLASAIYVGNGNDIDNIPGNIEGWVEKHPEIFELSLLDLFEGNSAASPASPEDGTIPQDAAPTPGPHTPQTLPPEIERLEPAPNNVIA